MKIRSVSRVLLAATPMVVGGILASGSSALAQSNNGPCSNATLSGDYAGRFAGTILATASDPETQVTGVTLTHYEGNGSFTSVEHVVFSGFPPPPGGEWTPASGTYTVNEDCTGSSVTHSANTPPAGLPQHFVVVDNGNKIQSVVDFGAFDSIATKVSGAARSRPQTLLEPNALWRLRIHGRRGSSGLTGQTSRSGPCPCNISMAEAI